MKTISKISISFTVLILLMFGTAGVCVAKCSCTGKTTLVLPVERGCCPIESGCMSIAVVHVSDYVVQHLTNAPQPTMVYCSPLFGHHNTFQAQSGKREAGSVLTHYGLWDAPPPLTDIVGTVVLRV